MGTLLKAVFFSETRGPIFLEAPDLWVRCRRRFFFSTIKGPIFLEAPNLWVRCSRLFFSRRMAPYSCVNEKGGEGEGGCWTFTRTR